MYAHLKSPESSVNFKDKLRTTRTDEANITSQESGDGTYLISHSNRGSEMGRG